LGQHLIDIRIGLDIKVDSQLHGPVAGVEGVHVIHVIHAAHLLLDGRGHRLLNR
jgi:hypothetical protein